MAMCKQELLKCSEGFFTQVFGAAIDDSMGEGAKIVRMEEIAEELLPQYILDLGLIYTPESVSGYDVMMYHLINDRSVLA